MKTSTAKKYVNKIIQKKKKKDSVDSLLLAVSMVNKDVCGVRNAAE